MLLPTEYLTEPQFDTSLFMFALFSVCALTFLEKKACLVQNVVILMKRKMLSKSKTFQSMLLTA